MDQESENDAIAHMFDRMRAPTSEAEWELIEARQRLRRANELLDVLVDIARTGGGL